MFSKKDINMFQENLRADLYIGTDLNMSIPLLNSLPSG